MRNFKVRLFCFAFAVTFLGSGSVAANDQQTYTVGQLLESGAMVLVDEDLKKVITGATASGVQLSNKSRGARLTYSATGEVTDNSYSMSGVTAASSSDLGVFGRWYIDNQKVCFELKTTGRRSNSQCQVWIRSSDKYFVSLDGNSSSVAVERRMGK